MPESRGWQGCIFAVTAALGCIASPHIAAAQPAEPTDSAATEPAPEDLVDPSSSVDEPEASEELEDEALPPPDPPVDASQLPYFPFNVGFIYPMATNAGRPNLWTHFDLALIVSQVGVVDGLQIGVINWTEYVLRGVGISAANAVGSRVEGIHISGLSYVDGKVEGLQIGGLFNWTRWNNGLQIAGLVNQTAGNFNGVQVAGFLNVSRRIHSGVQAGAVNAGRVDGLQVGGFNLSKHGKGLQIGAVNIAQRFDGLQIGIVNITDTLHGESLAILPLPREGGIHLATWISNTFFGNVGVKFASKYAYSLWSFAVGKDDGDTVYAPGLTLGAEFRTPIPEILVGADFGAYRRFRDRFTFNGRDEVLKVRVHGGYEIAPLFTPFLGAGAALEVQSDEADNTLAEVLPEVFLGVEL